MEHSNKKTVLVTGGAGYIGSIVVKTLLDNKYDVVVVDNLTTGHRAAVDRRAGFELTDVGDKLAMSQILQKYHIDAVIDFAASIAVGESMKQPVKYFQNNVVNFVSLLDLMAVNNVKFLIKSSTAAVYGTPVKDTDLPLSEDYTDLAKPQYSALLAGNWDGQVVSGDIFFQKLMSYYKEVFSTRTDLQLSKEEIIKLKIPPSVYGLTKLLDEIILNKYNVISGLKSITLRYFNVAGADPSGQLGQDNDNPTHLFASAIFQALGKSKKLTIFGTDYPTKDGTGIRDYIHVNDLATGHLAALEYLFREQKSDTINLGTGTGFSVFEVITAIEKVAQKKITYDIGPRRSGDVAKLYANPARAKQVLNWTAKYSLNDMAQTAWAWHSGHPDGYGN